MTRHWPARILTTALTIMFMTQPSFAARVRKGGTKAVRAVVEASHRRLQAVMVRGEDVSPALRLKYEDRIAALSAQVDLEAETDAAKVADRLGTEFRMSAEQFAAEHEACGGSWGDLMIARTLQASAVFGITPAQVFVLHKNGMAWTMVAHGLGLDMDNVTNVIEAECHVALGDVKPDGKLPAIGPDPQSNNVTP